MGKLSKREKTLLLVMVIVVVVFGYLKFYLLPTMSKLTVAKTEITKYNDELRTINLYQTENQKLQLNLKDLKKELDELSASLPQDERNPEIIYEIKLIGDKSSINIDSISLGGNDNSQAGLSIEGGKLTLNGPNTKNDNKYKDLKISKSPAVIDISAKNYNDIMNFIKGIENDKRMSEITSVSISTKEHAANTNLNQSQIQMFSGLTNGLTEQAVSKAATSSDSGYLQATINVDYLYVDDGKTLNEADVKYDFNKGVYGKKDLFK